MAPRRDPDRPVVLCRIFAKDPESAAAHAACHIAAMGWAARTKAIVEKPLVLTVRLEGPLGQKKVGQFGAGSAAIEAMRSNGLILRLYVVSLPVVALMWSGWSPFDSAAWGSLGKEDVHDVHGSLRSGAVIVRIGNLTSSISRALMRGFGAPRFTAEIGPDGSVEVGVG